MVERESPQLLLVSTAHRLATPLMLEHRQLALEQLEEGDGRAADRMVAPRGTAPVEELESWRLASAALDGAAAADDPEAARRRAVEPVRGSGRDRPGRLVPVAVAERVADQSRRHDRARGSVAARGLGRPDRAGREVDRAGLGGVGGQLRFRRRRRRHRPARRTAGFEVDGWLRNDWDTAVADVATARTGPSASCWSAQSLMDRVPAGMVPRPQGGERHQHPDRALAAPRPRERRPARPRRGDHARSTRRSALAQVRESSTGLLLVGGGDRHLVRAVVWAVGAAHKPAPDAGDQMTQTGLAVSVGLRLPCGGHGSPSERLEMKTILVLAVAAAVLFVAGCGGGGETFNVSERFSEEVGAEAACSEEGFEEIAGEREMTYTCSLRDERLLAVQRRSSLCA